jgi:hypothetical protein
MSQRITVVSLLLLLFWRRTEASSSFLEELRNLQGFGVGGDLETPPPVVVPVATTAPIALGTAGKHWKAVEYAYHYQLYTASTGRAVEAIAAVDQAARDSFQQFVFQEKAPVTLQRLASTVLGMLR